MVQDGDCLPQIVAMGLLRRARLTHGPACPFLLPKAGCHRAFGLQIQQRLALAAICNVAPVKRGTQLPNGGKAAAAAAPLTPQPTGPRLLTPVLRRSGLASLPAAACLQEETSRRQRDHRLPVQVADSPVGRPAGVALPASLPLQELEAQEGMLDAGWLGVSLMPAFAAPRLISASEGLVPSRMGQGRWQCPTCCTYLWLDSRPSTFQRR